MRERGHTPQVVRRQRCRLDNGREIEVLGYDRVIGDGEDGRATRWDSLTRDGSGQIVDSRPISAALAQSLLQAASVREMRATA